MTLREQRVSRHTTSPFVWYNATMAYTKSNSNETEMHMSQTRTSSLIRLNSERIRMTTYPTPFKRRRVDVRILFTLCRFIFFHLHLHELVKPLRYDLDVVTMSVYNVLDIRGSEKR